MALESTTAITRPGQDGATGPVNALHVTEYTGVVHETIARRSILEPWIQARPVKGTSVIQSFAVGESTLQKVTPGVTPDGTVNKAGKATLSIDTLVLARSIFPLLDEFQSSYNARAVVGREHGKKIAKFKDQSFFIQAIKAALATDTKYTGVSGAGHSGGNRVTMASANDRLDPAKLYAYLVDLFVLFEKKDIDPRADDAIVVVRPDEYALLEQNELLIDRNYVTSEGNSVQVAALKARGVPVVSSNNAPLLQTVTGHLLSNADNGNAYDGDFTKVLAQVFCPPALLAGETIPLTTAVFWDEKSKMWFVDAHLSYGVTFDRADHAGAILLP